MAKRRAPENCYWRGETLWGRVAVAGLEHRRSLRTADPREAGIRVQAWKLRLERDSYGAADAHSYQDAVLRWSAEVLPDALKPQAARRYLTSMVALDATFGNLRIPQITTQVVSGFVSSRKGLVTNATIRRDLTALSSLLSACVAWGWTSSNPAKFFDRSIIRERREMIRPPELAAIETFIGYAPAAMGHIVRLLAATGMRENEAVTLERGHIDWQGGRILLTRTKSGRARSLAWSTPGGDAGPLLRAAVAVLGTPLMFPTSGLTAYASFASGFGTVMRKVVDGEADAGRAFTRFRAHDLRHGFAIRWLRAGGDIYRLSKHLGHTSVKTTEGYLAYLTSEEQDAVSGVQMTAQGR